MFTFNKKFFFRALVFFCVEVVIALFVHDSFVRPYIGDYLVVFLIYYAVRTFVKARILTTALCVLAFSYTIEVLQYFGLVKRLGLEKNYIAKTVIGYGFEWLDLVAYTLGVITILLLERKSIANNRKLAA